MGGEGTVEKLDLQSAVNSVTPVDGAHAHSVPIVARSCSDIPLILKIII